MAESPFQLSEQMQTALDNEQTKGVGRYRFRLTARMREAAILYAEGQLTFVAICKQLKVHDKTFSKWLDQPEFERLVEHHKKKLATEMSRVTLANKVQRIRAKQSRHDRLTRTIEKRAELYKDVPGGADEGMMCRDVKMIGRGENAVEVEVFRTDGALLTAMDNLERDIATEVGQWDEQKGLADFGKPPTNDYKLSVEDRRTFIMQIFADIGKPLTPEQITNLSEQAKTVSGEGP
jgi:hypothetical protein